jgi:hypothetical protein
MTDTVFISKENATLKNSALSGALPLRPLIVSAYASNFICGLWRAIKNQVFNKRAFLFRNILQNREHARIDNSKSIPALEA